MLLESRLFSFLDKKGTFTIHFFEGQKIIHDIILMNKMDEKGFKFLREFILSFQPMISFLKPGEGFGIYIDSEDPFFRLKIETNASGQMRTLLLPEDLTEYPDEISGTCRISKLFPRKNQQSYTSVIKLEKTKLRAIANQILKESYQVQSEVIFSDDSDQSILYMKLPKINVDKDSSDEMSLEEYKTLQLPLFKSIFSKGLNKEEEIIQEFENNDYQYLASKEVFFKCACSRERMIIGLKSLTSSSVDDLFDPGKDSLETHCDYCKTSYLIEKKELL